MTQSGRSALLTNVVADDATGEAGQDRREGGQPWQVRHIPIGRGHRAEEPVPGNPAADRRIAAKTRSGVGRGNRRRGENDRRDVSEWRNIWPNGLPNEGRSPKPGHRMVAEGMRFP